MSKEHRQQSSIMRQVLQTHTMPYIMPHASSHAFERFVDADNASDKPVLDNAHPVINHEVLGKIGEMLAANIATACNLRHITEYKNISSRLEARPAQQSSSALNAEKLSSS